MAHSRGDLPDNPKDALRDYILELERNYYPWYRKSSTRHAWAWGIGQGVAIVAGILAAVLAAAAREDTFESFGRLRTALILLPIIGAVASALLAQTRVRELLALRERGREQMQALISQARADYAAASHDFDELSAIHRALVAQVARLEREQAAEFLTVAPGASPNSPGSGG